VAQPSYTYHLSFICIQLFSIFLINSWDKYLALWTISRRDLSNTCRFIILLCHEDPTGILASEEQKSSRMCFLHIESRTTRKLAKKPFHSPETWLVFLAKGPVNRGTASGHRMITLTKNFVNPSWIMTKINHLSWN
jgi:hypothetical protein